MTGTASPSYIHVRVPGEEELLAGPLEFSRVDPRLALEGVLGSPLTPCVLGITEVDREAPVLFTAEVASRPAEPRDEETCLEPVAGP